MHTTVVPSIDGDRLEARISGLKTPIYYEWRGPDGWALPPPENDNFALLAGLSHAMGQGGRLHVQGRVDRDLLNGVEQYVAFWAFTRPDLFKVVQVSADEELAPRPRDPTRGHAFAVSAGLDSTFSLMRNAGGSDARLTRRPGAAFLMQWDSPRNTPDKRAWIEALRVRAERSTAALGLPLLTCDTNWRALCVDYFAEHPLGIVAAAHALNGFTAGCMLAADVTYTVEGELVPFGNNHVAVPRLSASHFEVLQYGGQYSRAQKLRMVAQRPELLGELVVCHARPSARVNCGRCEKCLRTGLELYTLTGEVRPFLDELPLPWRVAWQKPGTKVTVAFWRVIMKAMPARFVGLRAAFAFWTLRSALQRTPLMRALRAAEKGIGAPRKAPLSDRILAPTQ